MKKSRLDERVLELGLVETRAKAKALILASEVLVDDVPMTKAGDLVSDDAKIRLRSEKPLFVSRGGLKLEAALKEFGLENLKNKTALDVGASTGGFTDVLLQKGVALVFAVDVGRGQMDWKIRSDPRVRVIEETNARNMTFDRIGQRVDIIVMDLSFISLTKVVPNLLQFASNETEWVTLIKPQFEAGRADVGKGGIVKDPEVHKRVIHDVSAQLETHGLVRKGLLKSPITGTSGNTEYLARWIKNP